MTCQRIKIEFFHDVVCGWCFVMSPRLRQIAHELSVEIEHRSFVLQSSRAEMVHVFGSMERAKATILGHWENCALHDDALRINVAGMWLQSFEYPSGLPGAIACKAAENQRGQDGHWDMFDAIQRAHLTENFNIADREVLLSVARDIGLDLDRLAADLDRPETLQQVEGDRRRARELGIRSIPTVVVWPSGARFQTTPLADLRRQLGELTAVNRS